MPAFHCVLLFKLVLILHCFITGQNPSVSFVPFPLPAKYPCFHILGNWELVATVVTGSSYPETSLGGCDDEMHGIDGWLFE